MFECLIIGDSIATGIHQHKPECAVYARVGMSTPGWLAQFGHKGLVGKLVVISLGTNDADSYPTLDKLMAVRRSIQGRKVFWIAPSQETRPTKLKDVQQVAAHFNDALLTPKAYAPDRIHPTSTAYRSLAESIRHTVHKTIVVYCIHV